MKERKQKGREGKRRKKKNQISFPNDNDTLLYIFVNGLCTSNLHFIKIFFQQNYTHGLKQFKRTIRFFGISKKKRGGEKNLAKLLHWREKLTGVSLQQPESKLNFFCSQLPFNHRCHPPSEWGREKGEGRGRGAFIPHEFTNFLSAPSHTGKHHPLGAVNDQEQRGRDKKTAHCWSRVRKDFVNYR